MKKNIVVSVIVSAFVFGTAGYFIGAQTAAASRTLIGAGQRVGAGSFSGGMRTGGMRGSTAQGFIGGEVISKDTSSITLKLRDGGSRIVILGTSTPVMKSAPGSITDITTGAQIMVVGKATTDGSFKAESISIR